MLYWVVVDEIDEYVVDCVVIIVVEYDDCVVVGGCVCLV